MKIIINEEEWINLHSKLNQIIENTNPDRRIILEQHPNLMIELKAINNKLNALCSLNKLRLPNNKSKEDKTFLKYLNKQTKKWKHTDFV